MSETDRDVGDLDGGRGVLRETLSRLEDNRPVYTHTRAHGQVYGALFRRLSDATTLDESAQSERASARAEVCDVPETEDKGLSHFCTCTCLIC